MKNIPRHIAVIMDGNGRWAALRKMPRLHGHIKGIEAVRRVVKAADDLGVKYLTLYSFSSENWKRPAKEVSFLFRLMEETLKRETAGLHKKNVKVRFTGRIDRLPSNLKATVRETESLTRGNTGLVLIFAMNYGGRREILDAFAKIPLPEQKKLNEERFRKFLYLPDVPDPDLVIRTAGEKRLSNFLAWETVYSELHFTKTLWPDFGGKGLARACREYAKRTRRFGGL